MIYLVEVTWGERIGLAVERWEKAKPGRNRTALFEAVGELTNVTRNSVSKYLSKKEPPRRNAEQARAVLLLLAVGEDPADYGLSEDALPRYLTADIMEAALASHSATCLMSSPVLAHVA